MSGEKRGVSVTVIKADDETRMEPVLKAESSVQIDEDEKMHANDWPEPELPLDGLEEIVKNSSILPQCCRAYKSNIAGYGIGIKYKEDDQEETKEALAEWTQLEDILNLLTIEQDTKEVFEDIIEAREKFGIAYCEVIRNNAGEVVQIEFVRETIYMCKSRPLEPFVEATYLYKGREIKRKKRFRKYKQSIGGTTVYYKEFGDPRRMDYRDGKYGDSVPKEYQANEIIDFAIGMDTYGEVRWIGQILGCDGARRAENLNNNYFIDGRHIPLAIVVKGGTLTDESIKHIREYLNGVRGEKGQHSFLLLEAQNNESDFDTKMPEVEMKDLASILQKDELFQDYIDNNRRKVQSAFNLPDLYVGYTTDFNRATAQTAMEVTEKQVFQPERKSLAWVINNRLLNGYNFQYVEVEFLAPDITNPDDLYKILTVAEKAGGLPPNKAKQVAYDALGETAEDYDGEWGEVPVIIQQQQAQAEAAKNNLMAQLSTQIEKAQKNDEPDSVISVLKQVHNLLSEIKGAQE